MALQTPKSRSFSESLTGTPSINDQMLYPWNWSEEARNVDLSPNNSCSSPEYRERNMLPNNTEPRTDTEAVPDNLRRGRPRADVLTHLMKQGSTSPSNIKCRYCNRVFPREKSLQAHLRTHTGERPYLCDFPGCTRAFAQSGQLKTHQRLHTGEKPFLCTEAECGRRFTHANRHCPEHPYANLTRSDNFTLQPVAENTELSLDITRWLERYKESRRKEERTPTGKIGHKRKEWDNNENFKKLKSRKGLVMDDIAGEQENLNCKVQKQRSYSAESQDSQYDSQDEACAILQTSEDEDLMSSKLTTSPLANPLDRLQPKKRWLREAFMQQRLTHLVNLETNNNSTLTSGAMNDEGINLNDPSTPSSSSNCNSNLLWTLSNTSPSSCLKEDFWTTQSSVETSDMQQEIKENIYSERTVALEETRWHHQHFSILQDRKNVDCELTNSMLKNINEEPETISIPKSVMVTSKPILNETRPTVLMFKGSGNNNITEKKVNLKMPLVDLSTKNNNHTTIKEEDSIVKLPSPESNKEVMGAALALIELAEREGGTSAESVEIKIEIDDPPCTQITPIYSHL